MLFHVINDLFQTKMHQMDYRHYKLIPQIRKASSKSSVRCGQMENIIITSVIIIIIIMLLTQCHIAEIYTYYKYTKQTHR